MDSSLYQAQCTVLTAALMAFALLGACRLLRRRGPLPPLEWPLLAGFALRFAMILVVTLVDDSRALRGPDEQAFLDLATRLADLPLYAADWRQGGFADLHTVVMGLHLAMLGDPGDSSLRLVQATAELVGILCIAAAVNDLAGPRAAVLFAWIAALEPTNAFYSTILHKESFAALGAGVVVLGAASLWRRRTAEAVVLIVLGLGVAGATRAYTAGALAAGVVCVAAHRWLVSRCSGRRAMAVMAAVLLLGLGAGAAAAPRVAAGPLARLQALHDFVPTTGSNLQLPPANVSTTAGLLRTLTVRAIDLVVRPYPWQRAGASQQLGSIGTLLWWSLLVTVGVVLARDRTRWHDGVIVLTYFALFQLIAFAMTLNNAGLGFRHRMHLIILVAAVAAIVVRGTRYDQPAPAVGPSVPAS